jgi:hypothetical protein
LFPPLPKKKLGRPPKVKVPPATDANTPLQRFLDECFDTTDPDGKTLVALVPARHRLWRRSHVIREEVTKMKVFFKERFDIRPEVDKEHDMTSSYYRGVTMRPWAPPVAAGEAADVDAFVRESCELHVMGRARTNDLCDAFAAWKQEREHGYTLTAKERARFISHMQESFVYDTGVPITKTAAGAPGFYGLYLNTATEECRSVGYNRSPNTRTAVLKLDALGNIVDTIDSQDAFAHNVMKKSSVHICNQLTTCFKDGMRGLVHDGYCYMRASDHAKKMGI